MDYQETACLDNIANIIVSLTYVPPKSNNYQLHVGFLALSSTKTLRFIN